MSFLTKQVTMKGEPLTLVGHEVEVGDEAPDFTVIDNDLNPVKFSDMEKMRYIITSVPSLDTPVCDAETRRFNEESKKLGSDVQVLTISMDLPFAQKRWCAAKDIDNVKTLSDHRDASFGKAYGVLIEELRLLARTVFVIDKEGKVRYIQFVDEVTNEPDYDKALEAVKNLG